MKRANPSAEQPKRLLTRLLCVLCALAVMAAALLVRRSPALSRDMADSVREAYTD